MLKESSPTQRVVLELVHAAKLGFQNQPNGQGFNYYYGTPQY